MFHTAERNVCLASQDKPNDHEHKRTQHRDTDQPNHAPHRPPSATRKLPDVGGDTTQSPQLTLRGIAPSRSRLDLFLTIACKCDLNGGHERAGAAPAS
jgi:hypothetical protein